MSEFKDAGVQMVMVVEAVDPGCAVSTERRLELKTRPQVLQKLLQTHRHRQGPKMDFATRLILSQVAESKSASIKSPTAVKTSIAQEIKSKSSDMRIQMDVSRDVLDISVGDHFAVWISVLKEPYMDICWDTTPLPDAATTGAISSRLRKEEREIEDRYNAYDYVALQTIIDGPVAADKDTACHLLACAGGMLCSITGSSSSVTALFGKAELASRFVVGLQKRQKPKL